MDGGGGASAAIQGPRSSGQGGEPRPGDNAHSRNFARSSVIRALMTTSRRLAAPGPHPTSRPRCCSPSRTAARWINGANLPVDGGLEASINATVLGF